MAGVLIRRGDWNTDTHREKTTRINEKPRRDASKEIHPFETLISDC
jgi:hypothetical protein